MCSPQVASFDLPVDGSFYSEFQRLSPRGSLYSGLVRDCKPSGEGLLDGPAGKYEGGFLDGKFHGRGLFSRANGDKCNSNFNMGEHEGTCEVRTCRVV